MVGLSFPLLQAVEVLEPHFDHQRRPVGRATLPFRGLADRCSRAQDLLPIDRYMRIIEVVGQEIDL